MALSLPVLLTLSKPGNRLSQNYCFGAKEASVFPWHLDF